jgi:hypothetical protein
MRNLYINNSNLIKDKKKTYLSSSADAAATTLTVDSIVGVAVDQFLLIGELGNEKTEIAQTHDSTAPSGSTVTLDSGITFAHPQGASVLVIDWDKVEISWAASTTGDKTVLDTIDLQVDNTETKYSDSTKSSGYYFFRFKNSIDDTFSSYSDAIPYGDFSSDTVAKIIQYALKRNKLETFTKFVDYDFCIEEINSCIKYITGKLKKWTKLQDFDYALGSATRGVNYLALPTNIWNDSYKSILDVRIDGGDSLSYVDKKEMNELMVGVYKATAEATTAGSTEMVVDDATHFLDDGNVKVGSMIISYESKDGNSLEGIPATGTGSITSNIDAGTNVWQGVEESTPEYYTVFGGNLYWYPLTSSSTPTVNLIADFWIEAPEVDSDSDTIDVYRYDMVKHWLTWAIRCQIKNDGIRNMQDGDYVQFEVMLRDAIKGEITGQKYKTKPSLNRILY